MREEESFLYYARSSDDWVCPSCETEIEASAGSCFLCGCSKQVWFAQREEEARRQAAEVYAAPNYEKPSVMPRVIAAILVIVLILALYYFASDAAEAEILTETEEIFSVM